MAAEVGEGGGDGEGGDAGRATGTGRRVLWAEAGAVQQLRGGGRRRPTNPPWPGQRTALHGAEQCWPLQRGAGQSGVGAAETGRIAVRERLHRRLFPLFWHEAREPLHRAGPPPDFRPKQLTQET